MAIGFWIYVTWFSSRIIAILKLRKQQEHLLKLIRNHPSAQTDKKIENITYFELPVTWLSLWPKLIGYAGLLAIEVAVLQSPALGSNAHLTRKKRCWYFIPALGISLGLDRIVEKFCIEEQRTKQLTRLQFPAGCFPAGLRTGGDHSQRKYSFTCSWALLFLHAVYLFYINLRSQKKDKWGMMRKDSWYHRFMYRIMDWVRIPRKEIGYFQWFNLICLIGLCIYCAAFINLHTAKMIGPFPFVLLAFAVLGGIGNIVAAISVKFSVNFHVLLILLALLVGSKETHLVRTKSFDKPVNKGIYHQRQDILTYF